MRPRVMAKLKQEEALKWASKRERMLQAARHRRAEHAQGVLTEEHTFKPEIAACPPSSRTRHEAENGSPESSSTAGDVQSPAVAGKRSTKPSKIRNAPGPEKADTGRIAVLNVALNEALDEVERWKERCKEVAVSLCRAELELRRKDKEISELRGLYEALLRRSQTNREELEGRPSTEDLYFAGVDGPGDLHGSSSSGALRLLLLALITLMLRHSADVRILGDEASNDSEFTAVFGKSPRESPRRKRSPSPEPLERIVRQLGDMLRSNREALIHGRHDHP
ncbi:hypothetical protein FOZ63_001894 [Perkinsus olseni]|uniref:Uncharacterized protein n=1 Tax=Perkinsus olseni TaxID=32597 RepID=A0A7J6Q4E4_PEROL|nr:hypothetical protein FOZ63_001894 [Perkinsus olseni]